MLIFSQILIEHANSALNPNSIFNSAFVNLFVKEKSNIFQQNEQITVSLLSFLKEGDLYFIIGTNIGKV